MYYTPPLWIGLTYRELLRMPPDQTSIFVYTVKEDTGFAPNPFHGVCTLATCKPDIRKVVKPGDFVIGKAKAPHGIRAVVVMEVNEILTFDEYWHNPEFACKKPRPNGDPIHACGDNIYHRFSDGSWVQAPSFHDVDDIEHDTGKTQSVLVARNFTYFGAEGPDLPGLHDKPLNKRHQEYAAQLPEPGRPPGTGRVDRFTDRSRGASRCRLTLGSRARTRAVADPKRFATKTVVCVAAARSAPATPVPVVGGCDKNALTFSMQCNWLQKRLCYTGGMRIGYARVSTHEQTLDLQIDSLKAAGCEHDHIYVDSISGSVRGVERPGLGEALAYARAGDQLVIWRLDRLGRSLKDLIEQVAGLERREIELVSLQERIDTTTPAGRALFQICGVMAEFERNLISERTKAGLAAARARGRKGGRKPKMTPAKIDRAAELMRERRLTVREIADLSGVTTTTLYRHLTPDGEPRAGAPTLVQG